MQNIQRSFTSGELSPALRTRADLSRYATGLALCQNFIVRPQGGVYSRPGLRFVGEVGQSAKRPRLIPFSFNTEQTYILVFEEYKMRVVKDGAFVIAGAGPALFELTTPYAESDLDRLGFTQSADVMTIVHPDYDPRNLSRLADDNWTLSVISYAPTVTTPTGVGVATVGTGAGTYNKTYTYVVTSVDADGIESLPSSSASITTASLSVTAGVRITWTPVAGTDYYRVYKDPSDATGIYGWIGDSNNAQFDDFNIAPITSDAPPQDRQPFAGAGNKPSTVNYYQQRQIFANTTNEPQAVFTTQTGNYVSLRTSTPTRDDDAVTLTIAGRQVNEIRHIVAVNELILLTSGGEWKVTEGQDQVLTPSTVGVRIQSYNGSSWVPPAVINDTVVYVQEKGARIRDLAYSFADDKYNGNDLSIMSEHLFEDHTIVEMAYSAEPYSVLWCIRSDGVLLGLTYQREQQVFGWHQHTTDGTFESIATITEDGRDAVYVVVKRTINGADVRYVERLEKRITSSAAESFCVDSGLSYNGSPVTSITGLDHLEGEEVTVLSDGNVVTGLTVQGGGITLPRAASIVHVGLPYTPAIETLDVEITPNPTQSAKAYDVSISEVTMEFDRSRGGWVAPKLGNGQLGTAFEIKPRLDSDGYDTIALRTYKADVYIDPVWPKGGGLRIEQRAPLPMTILSVIPEIDIGG